VSEAIKIAVKLTISRQIKKEAEIFAAAEYLTAERQICRQYAFVNN